MTQRCSIRANRSSLGIMRVEHCRQTRLRMPHLLGVQSSEESNPVAGSKLPAVPYHQSICNEAREVSLVQTSTSGNYRKGRVLVNSRGRNCKHLTHDVPCMDNYPSPELARLYPPVIRGLCAEDKQYGQCKAGGTEGVCRAEGQRRTPRRQVAILQVARTSI